MLRNVPDSEYACNYLTLFTLICSSQQCPTSHSYRFTIDLNIWERPSTSTACHFDSGLCALLQGKSTVAAEGAENLTTLLSLARFTQKRLDAGI